LIDSYSFNKLPFIIIHTIIKWVRDEKSILFRVLAVVEGLRKVIIKSSKKRGIVEGFLVYHFFGKPKINPNLIEKS